jgi:Endonuclease IV (EC 3.1.21.-)
MVRVGVHVSIAGAIGKSVERAAERGCDTFQIFSRNPRGWAARDLSPHDADLFRRNLEETHIGPVVDHMPYLPNLASPDPALYAKSLSTLTAELVRCDSLGIPFLVTHLGHHQGSDGEEGRKRVIHALNAALSAAGGDTVILLENTAGGEEQRRQPVFGYPYHPGWNRGCHAGSGVPGYLPRLRCRL